MFFAVILTESRKLLTIPAAWCYRLDIVKNFKSGLRQWRDKVVFYSPNILADPNFRLEIQTEFEDDKDACYMANILGTFYSVEDSNTYLDKRRNILPRLYAESRIALTELEPEVVVQIDDPLIKQENLSCTNHVQEGFVDLTVNSSNEGENELNIDLAEFDSYGNEREVDEEANEQENNDVVEAATNTNLVDQANNSVEFDSIENRDTSVQNGSEIEVAEQQNHNEPVETNEQNVEIQDEAASVAVGEENVETERERVQVRKQNGFVSGLDSDDEDYFPVGTVVPKPYHTKEEDELSGVIPFLLRVISSINN